MGRITSNVGLITGIPITDTVDQLIAVASQPRDLLSSRTQGLQQQQLAINTLSTRLLSLQFDLGKLKVSTPFQARTVTSQDETVLTATIASGGKPPLGSFALQPVQTASSQQLISQRFESLDDIQSSGSISFGFGGFVNKGIALDDLNNGEGVKRGEIKITDLAGNSAILGLSLAKTVDDVLDTINNEASLNVTASVNGDRLTLSDNIGGASTLTVQEVNGGSTAADLGLAGISTTASSATGADVFGLHSGTKLTKLNDDSGVRTQAGVDDLFFTLADETADLSLDLSGAATLGDVVDTINSDANLAGKVTATIAADGNRLELTDLTSGAGAFTVTSGATGSAAEDLGLTNAASGGVITGNRLISGLRDTLLSSLNGGQGFGTLGNVDLTDRSTATATVDLSSAETLGEIVDLLNTSGTNIVASINEAGSGILLNDSVGGAGNLIVSNNIDGLLTADALGITVDAAQDSIDSRSLNRQTLSEATLLSSLNGGEGITASDITITDSNGVSDSIDLNSSGSEAETIGDVIDAINASVKLGVTARINDTGDGILLVNSAQGGGVLGVKDVNGTLAADLNLTRASETIDVNGTETQVVDGTRGYSIDLSDIDGSAESVSLASLNEGSGINFSDIRITDSSGNNTLALDLNGTYAGITTVGQLIDALNAEATAQGVGVTASINSSGTGILLIDTAGGPENLLVEDVNGTAAADLKILSTESTTTTIDGIGLFSSQTASQGALETVADRINELESGVTASVLNDGQGFRLQLVVDQTGAANEILLDAGDSGFAFDELASARDALLVIGGQGTPGSGVLISSSTNDFSDVISDVNLTVQATSDTAIDVTVAKSDEDLIALVEEFVDSYNAIRSDLDDLTDFNETDFTTGLLFGTNEALRVDTQLSRVITDRYFGVGSFQSLEEIGLSVDSAGKLQLNKTELQEAFTEDSQSLQNFFTDDDDGIVAKFDAAIESLAGADNGLLTNRNNTLQSTIDTNQLRIDQLNESLDRQRETLLLQFFQLEQVIAGLRASQTALDALQPVSPLVSAG